MTNDPHTPDRIMVVDDDPDMHAIYLTAYGDRIIAQAYDGEEGVKMYDEHKPDLVIMDWQMPMMNGLDATKAIVDAHPDATVVMLSWAPNDGFAKQMGAVGAFTKSMDPNEVMQIIDRALTPDE